MLYSILENHIIYKKWCICTNTNEKTPEGVFSCFLLACGEIEHGLSAYSSDRDRPFQIDRER